MQERLKSKPYEPQFPWEGDARFAACNFAFGDLLRNLPARTAFDGRIDAPTLLAAAGAIAGFAAQRALFARTDAWPAGMHIATTRAGHTFYFGDPLNDMLVPASPRDAPLRLWPLSAGAAMAADATPPGLDAMFAHVTTIIGHDGDFFPSPSGARPKLPCTGLLKRVWPLARDCFDGRLSGKILRDEGVVPQRWRPVVAAHVAHRGLRRSQAEIDAATGVAILVESAIYASKINPKLIETA
ncbi:MAG TPA: hypothetical protein PKA55_08195 [Rhodoblastus sp.]|nr:hypothetical protein [Rhodoblastus sp.]